jgi:GT2 family glycosyltransferase
MSEVSVVIPNRDGGALLERCLDAVAAARAVSEVVVVDDGSSDGSAERAEQRAGVRVLRSPGRGFAAAVNHGVASTRGGLVLLLNSDAFLRAETVELLAAELVARPPLALCGAGLVHADGSRAKSRDRSLTLRRALREAVSLHVAPLPEQRRFEAACFVPLACVLARRAAWDEVGGLDERFRFYFEDQDLCWRLGRAGWECGVLWEAEAVHLEGGSSRQRDPVAWFQQYHESRLSYLRKRYSRAWSLYLAVWAPSALAHAWLWLARAVLRRKEPAAAAEARAWAWAYLRAALPR